MKTSPAESAKPPKYARGCGLVFFCLMMVLSGLWGGALGAFAYIVEDAEDTIAALDTFRPNVGSRVYSSDGVLLGEFTTENRQLVPLSDIPLHVQEAFIATEDDLFYQHHGVRPLAILSAFVDYARDGGQLRGASTITQQLVRNVDVTGVSTERSYQRKILEAVVSLQLEREYTKDEILELYLNQIFLGVSAYGVEAASRQYFMKSCRDLTLSEAATLAGVTRWPNRNNPFRSMDEALNRRNLVLNQMVQEGFISEEERQQAKAESLEESVVTPAERAERTERGETIMAPNRFLAPYFVEEVRQFLLENGIVSAEMLYEDGLEIYTTVDVRMQTAAEKALLPSLDAFDANKKEQLAKSGAEKDFVPVSGALICLDNREGVEGYVRAMVGGRDFETEKFNAATQAKRLPGSAIKPFIWSAALEQGYTAASIVVDEPFVWEDEWGTHWEPKNFDGKFNGPITLRTALQKSVNIVSVKLVQDLGFPLVSSYLTRSGVTDWVDPQAKLTIALGSVQTTPIKLCLAYSTFAHNGVRYEPTILTEVRDRDGFVLYRSNRKQQQVLNPETAYVMNFLLQGVALYGTGSRTAPLKDRARGGKTGTTNNSVDVWFCGFTPDLTGVVWMGYGEGNSRPLGRGANYTGGRLACPVWTEFMLAAHEDIPLHDFEVPDGIQWYGVDKNTGLAGGSFREAFIKGTGPPTDWPLYLMDDDVDALIEGIPLLEEEAVLN